MSQAEEEAMNTSITVSLLVLCMSLFLVGCGRGPTPQEAFNVGFDLGIADRCGRINRSRTQMPSAYDDSMGRGRLEAAFSDGYNQAKRQPNACQCR